MTRTKEVEILPWVHYSTFQAHQDMLNYLFTLPEGSTVFLEIDPEDLELYETVFEQFSRFNRRIIVNYFNKDPQILALFELLMLCKRKRFNIQIPESRSSRIFGKKDQIAKAKYGGKYNEFREQNMSNNIVTYLMHNDVQKSYLVTGFRHSVSIDSLLSKAGIVTKLNFDYASDANVLKRILRLELMLRKAIKDSDFRFAELCQNAIDECASYFKLRGNSDESRIDPKILDQFLELAFGKKETNEERIKKKLRENKSRQIKIEKGVNRKLKLPRPRV